MPKQSIALSRDDFLYYMHLTQSEAAEIHNVSLSCYKRKFHEMFRPRIHWSTKKDRIILKQAINYPKNNKLTPELVDKVLNGTLRASSCVNHVQKSAHQNQVAALTKQKNEFSKSFDELVQMYRENQQNLQAIFLSQDEGENTFLGYPELLDGPWRSQLNSLEDSTDAPALIVLNRKWQIIAANDAFNMLLGYSPVQLMKGVQWTSLLPFSCEQDFVVQLLTAVVTESLSTVSTLVSRNNSLIKADIKIEKVDERGYYIFIHKNSSKSQKATLCINGEQSHQVPCIADADSCSMEEAVQCHNAQLQVLSDSSSSSHQQQKSTSHSNLQLQTKNQITSIDGDYWQSNSEGLLDSTLGDDSDMDNNNNYFESGRPMTCAIEEFNFGSPEGEYGEVSRLLGMQDIASPWQGMELY